MRNNHNQLREYGDRVSKVSRKRADCIESWEAASEARNKSEENTNPSRRNMLERMSGLAVMSPLLTSLQGSNSGSGDPSSLSELIEPYDELNSAREAIKKGVNSDLLTLLSDSGHLSSGDLSEFEMTSLVEEEEFSTAERNGMVAAGPHDNGDEIVPILMTKTYSTDEVIKLFIIPSQNRSYAIVESEDTVESGPQVYTSSSCPSGSCYRTYTWCSDYQCACVGGVAKFKEYTYCCVETSNGECCYRQDGYDCTGCKFSYCN